MPLPVSHGFVGAAIVAAVHPKTNKMFSIPLFTGAFFANLADVDFLFYLPGDLGFSFLADYEWHRGFTHSILFSIIVFAAISSYSGKNQLRASAGFGLAYFSHTVLDFVTTNVGGGGLELFWFLSDERYVLGWIGLSERSLQMTVTELAQALIVEAMIFGPMFFLVFYLRRFLQPATEEAI